MFIKNYVNDIYFDIICGNYSLDYLINLNENNFKRVYNILKTNDFYYINDIILNYLELFEVEYIYVEKALNTIKNILGENYVQIIGKNMPILDRVINLAISYI